MQSFFFFDLPGVVRVGYALGGVIGLQEESGAVAHLATGGLRAEAPDCGCEDVSSGVQKRGEIVGFKSPVGEISESGTGADTLLIYVQEKLVIGADVHEKMRGCLRQVEDLAEMKDESIAFGGVGTGNPLGGPGLGGEVRCELSVEGSLAENEY